MAGSVSGGCVEGDVVEHALAVLARGDPLIRRYGISDEQGLDVGLMCGERSRCSSNRSTARGRD